jgi:uncharacterized protein YggE
MTEEKNTHTSSHKNLDSSNVSKTSLHIPMQATILLVAIIISFSLILGSWMLSNRTTVIRSLGAETTQDGQIVNSITVNGQGIVSAKPDLVRISVRFEETRDTSQEALSAVNQKVNELEDILSGQGVAPEDITTTSFNLSPEYDFRGDNGRVLLGQEASQRISFVVREVDEEGAKAATVIDAISGIDNIQFGSINFDIENKEEIYSQARSQAIGQAKGRAEEIADVAEVELGSVVSISDVQRQEATPQDFQQDVFSSLESISARTGGSETSISTGELEVTLNLSVVYEINPR